MTSDKAVAEVFITAFRTLPSHEQQLVLARMLEVRKWRKDLMDIAIAESRSQEKSRPFRDFLKEIKK